MPAIDWVEVAEDGETALVGGAILRGGLLKFLESQDLLMSTGFCHTLGYAGRVLGGGYASSGGFTTL
jgi:hypothetical protein